MRRRWMHTYRVVCADSTLPSSYSLFGTQKKADILVTDPPYCLLERKRANGALRDEKKHQKKIDNAQEVPRFENLAHYRRFTDNWLKPAVSEGLKPHAPLVIWTNFLGRRILVDVCKELNYQCIGEYAWAKLSLDKRPAVGAFSPWNTSQSEVQLRVYEVALIFQSNELLKDLSIKPDEVLVRRDVETSELLVKNSHSLPWTVTSGYHDQVNGTSVPHKHPCHKPLPSLLPLIHNWTLDNDVVLDPFAGSGGVGDAVRAAGGAREYRGLEIIQNWADTVNNKLNT